MNWKAYVWPKSIPLPYFFLHKNRKPKNQTCIEAEWALSCQWWPLMTSCPKGTSTEGYRTRGSHGASMKLDFLTIQGREIISASKGLPREFIIDDNKASHRHSTLSSVRIVTFLPLVVDIKSGTLYIAAWILNEWNACLLCEMHAKHCPTRSTTSSLEKKGVQMQPHWS